MINSIEIQNFRGIRNCRIDGFARVNLFFGKNNCGKSSLLEGLFLVCGQSNPLLPNTINDMRAYKGVSEEDIRCFFYQMDTSQAIGILVSGNQERHLSITTIKEALPLDSSNVSTELPYSYGLKSVFGNREEEFSSTIMYDTSTPNAIIKKAHVDNRYTEKLKCKYLNPHNDFGASLEGVHNIYLNKDEDYLAEALKLMEPSAKNPLFIDNVMLVDIGLPQRIPINLMGDGIRRIVSFLTSIYASKDGVVLIDELSNGLHYSVMKPMWKIMLTAARKNNVQIFATTHDYDSIRGFKEAVAEMENLDGEELAAGYKLQKVAGDELRGYKYSASQLEYAIEQEMEVR